MDRMNAYLQSASYGWSRCCPAAGKGQYPFITISRETGAGGHTLAEALLKGMAARDMPLHDGWQVCDETLCRRVCEEPGLKTSVEKLMSMEYRSPIEDLIEEFVFGDSPQDLVMKKVFETMRAFASYGKVILVGRAGACVTRGLPLGIHIRLTAPLETRIARIMTLHRFDEKEAHIFITEQDKARAHLVRKFFNRDIADPLLYDMVFNTDRMAAAEIAHILIGRIAGKTHVCA